MWPTTHTLPHKKQNPMLASVVMIFCMCLCSSLDSPLHQWIKEETQSSRAANEFFSITGNRHFKSIAAICFTCHHPVGTDADHVWPIKGKTFLHQHFPVNSPLKTSSQWAHCKNEQHKKKIVCTNVKLSRRLHCHRHQRCPLFKPKGCFSPQRVFRPRNCICPRHLPRSQFHCHGSSRAEACHSFNSRQADHS